MSKDKYNQIVEECIKFRVAVEECINDIGMEWFNHFPLGCCLDTSLMLAKYFHAKGFGISELVSGCRENKSHAWLELDGLIIDITADQFDEVSEKIIVTKESEFHDSFNYERKRNAYNKSLTGSNFGDAYLFSAYPVICSHIKK